jgi:hypothetical protein
MLIIKLATRMLLILCGVACNVLADPAAKESHVHEIFAIKSHVFSVIGPDGSRSAARLVQEKGFGILSCFMAPPPALGLHGRFRTIASPEGPYHCIDGREALEQLASQKRLLQTWAIESGEENAGTCSDAPAMNTILSAPVAVAPSGKTCYIEFRGDKCIDDSYVWTYAQQQQLESDFWDAYAAEMSINAACWAACNAVLARLLAYCAALPPPGNELCALGAASLYVSCIARC